VSHGAQGGRPFIGILLAVAAVSCFSVLDSLAKHLTQSYPLPMVIWARYFVHVVIMLALLWPRMGWRLVASQRPGLQILRGVILGLSTLFFVSGLTMIPLAEASAITMVAPILLTLLARRFLRERAPPGTWWALMVSFAGVLLIVRPGGQVFGIAALLPLATAFCFASYQLLTRKLAGVDDGLATLFIGALVATVLASLFVPWHWALPRNWADAGLFLAMGAVGAFSHLLLVRAFERAPASLLAPFIYLQIVAALTLGWLAFGNFPDLVALAGMGLIALTGVTMALRGSGPLRPERQAPVAADVLAGEPAGAERAAAIAGPMLAPDGAPALPAEAAAPPPSVEPAMAMARAPLRGVLLAVGACVLFALLDSIAKHLSQAHSPLMVAWARYVFHVVIMVAIFAPSMGRKLFVTRSPGLQVARGLCLGMSSICFFTSIAFLPLAEATAIVAISPVLVTAGAVWWLKERTPPGAWLALSASFIGVLLIVRPGSALFGWAALLPLLTAVFAMGYQLLTRQLSGVDNGLATLFIGGAVAAVLLSLFAPGAWSLPTGPVDALLFVATGAIGALGHLMLVRAYEAASAASLAPYGYAHAASALVFGFVFFGQFPDRLGLLGLALIVVTGVVMALRGRARPAAPRPVR
jgi:drug/metabolite transporter (DMT)-like permease